MEVCGITGRLYPKFSRSWIKRIMYHPFWVDGVSEPDHKRLARWRFVATVEGGTPNFQGVTNDSNSLI
jgi:hypothetical protein